MKTVVKIYIAGLLYKTVKFWRFLLGKKSDIVQINRYGINWQLDLKEGIDLAIYIFGRFESQTVKTYQKWIEPGNTVLDIGANIGAHTLWFAKLVGKDGLTIAFEPTRYAYSKLKTNIQLNPDLGKRILAEQMLLSREDRQDYQVEIYSSWTVTGTAERHPKHLGELKSTEGAVMRQLDSYLLEKNIQKVDFIKIDVDGYECDVFLGAKSTLDRHKPVICLELSPYVLEERGASIEQLLDILHSHNYQLFHERTGYKLPMNAIQLSKIIGDGAGINAIARVEKRT
jgi:FkbM family methyltransferase